MPFSLSFHPFFLIPCLNGRLQSRNKHGAVMNLLCDGGLRTVTQWLIIHPPARLIGFPTCIVLGGNIGDWFCVPKKCNSVCNFVPLCILLNARTLFHSNVVCVRVCVHEYNYRQSNLHKPEVMILWNCLRPIGIPLTVLTAGGSVWARVEKQVDVCSGCASSDAIDLIQPGGNLEIRALRAAARCCSIREANSALTCGGQSYWRAGGAAGTLGKQKPSSPSL